MENTGGGQRRTPMHTAARVLTAAGLLASLGALGSGCLTRKVSGEPPTTKINYNSVIRQSAIDKIDLLFAIDNSSSMGDKQALFAEAVPDLLTRLLTPNCVDDAGNVLKDGAGKAITADANGKCSKGKPEFNPVQDLHIAIVSSSLGSFGTSVCDVNAPGNQGRLFDDKAHLLTRFKPPTTGTPNAAPTNFLTWLPDTQDNRDKGKLPTKDGTTPEPNRDALQADFQNMVTGVQDNGCGFEAQLESVYRFLIQPDPYAEAKTVNNATTLSGVDNDILQQRANFLRDDSLVAIIMLTDENDNTIDPMALGAHAWLYENTNAVKRGTPACTDPAKGPTSGECFSCFQQNAAGIPNCAGDDGYITNGDDDPNIRFFEPKKRFGYDPRFPIDRYITGFSQAKVPDRRSEHPVGDQGPSFNYVGNPTCTNPLFAKNSGNERLPTDGADVDKLCTLPRGPRTPDLVFFALIGGVPWQLLTDKPDDLSDSNSGKFKDRLDDTDWKRILGVDPLHYNYEGVNVRMRESVEKRAGVEVQGSDFRDWDTKKRDLQYACTFQLQKVRNCADDANKTACDCLNGSDSSLCDPNDKTKQIKGKAFPTVNELAVARAMRDQGVVASLCPKYPLVADQTAHPDEYGYRPAVQTIVNRLKDALTERCIPQPLEEDADGTVPCLITELEPTPGDQAAACDPAKGLEQPDPGVLARYRKEQEANKATPDELARPLCVIKQLKGAELVSNSCVASTKAGWCYVSRGKVSTEKCAQSIKFPDAFQRPNGAIINLQCIEQPPTANADAGP